MNFDEPDDDEVAAQLEEVTQEVEGLELENSVLEGFLRREQAAAQGTGAKKGRQKAYDGPGLTPGQKCEVGTAQLEVAQREMDEAKKASEKLIDTLKAVLEETESRVAELKKDAYEFKRDVVVGGENPRSGRTVSEKVVKYMEEKLAQRDLAIDKLKLKNGNLKAAVAKAEAELKAKDEAGDVLHYIDFHQLQIENKQSVSHGLAAPLALTVPLSCPCPDSHARRTPDRWPSLTR